MVKALKRASLIASVCVLVSAMSSCAAFPEPVREGDSLVIGSLILDFPEGLYDSTTRIVDMNVRLTFRNVARNQRFHVYTKRGYYYFLTNGLDDYFLESYKILNTDADGTLYSFSDQPVALKITNSPNQVIYLGHVTATYSAPRLLQRRGSGGRISYYRYDTIADVEWDRDLLRRYMTRRQPDSPWLDLEIIEYGRDSEARWQQQPFRVRRSHLNFLPQK